MIGGPDEGITSEQGGAMGESRDDLAGSAARKITSVRVSATLRPADPADEDPDAGARFTAQRRFAVEVSTTSCSATTATWRRI